MHISFYKLIQQLLIRMKNQCDQDGWDIIDIQDQKTMQQLPSQLRYHHKDAPRDILDSQHHSLEPDMILGWKPKLPSCPLPLSYNNVYVDSLTAHLSTDDRFKLAYLGPRYTNSVQLNQQYNYLWRYRSRYNTSINVVKQAVKRVGEGGRRIAMDFSENEISFDSAFESGNLDMAVRIKKSQYDLFLRCDTNTRGHTAWFYFKVNNKQQLGEIQFNICNFGKRKNLYAHGMRPYTFIDGQWSQQRCFEVNWAQRICRYGFEKKTFQLQFKHNFKVKNQSVIFAYALPYTYSRLQNFISQMGNKSKFMKTTRLCESLGGLDVPLLTITNNLQGQQNNSDENLSSTEAIRKKVVLITGRIHPGQTHSSYIIEGLIKYLLSDEPIAQMLRSSFVFYIVPMLNPDGVVAGNFRTSYCGKDLNRQFNKLNKYVFPQITALHELAFQLKQNHRSALQFYLDFHAHSSKRGLFCYGPDHAPGKNEFFKCRALAKLIQQNSPIFSYKKSIFAISEHKKTTGRAHMLWKLKIPMSFTFQVSNGLYQTKENKNNPFTQKILLELGTVLCNGLFRFGQLQMKLPSMKIRAKVDTGIKKRSGLSVKEFRKSSSKKGRTLTIKNMNYLKDLSSTQSCRADKFDKSVSIREVLENEAVKKKSAYKQEKEDFHSLIEQIKKQENEEHILDQYEGGSDSQSEGDDLEEKDLLKLHKIIQTRHENSKHYAKGNLQWRSHYKKQVVRRQSQSQQPKQVNISHQLDNPKKPVTAKYLMPLKFSALPPRAKRIPLIEPQKVVLPQKNFALEI